MHYYRFIVPAITILCFLQSCTKDTSYVATIPPSDNPYLLQVDTFSSAGIIYRPDSFITANKTLLFSGIHKDPIFGIVNCTPYFRPSLPASAPELGNNSYFDSLVLVIKPKTIYYGDTTSIYKLSLFRLSENMYHSGGDVFYNNHSFGVYPGAIGAASVVYRPNNDDSIIIKMDENLGRELFALFKTNSNTIKDAAVFKDYLKGFRIEAATTDNVIYAFAANDSTLEMRLHYHNDNGKQQEQRIDFSLTTDAYAFTNINTNYTGTPLANLNVNKELPATNLLVNQELTGVKTRINFPYLKDGLKLGSYVKVLYAALEVKPVTARYAATYLLPPALNVYYYNASASLEGPLVSSVTSAAQTGDLQVDENFGLDTRYTFDITSYVNAELTATNYTTKGLVLTTADANNSLYQLVAGMPGNTQYKTKLILSLLVYNQ